MEVLTVVPGDKLGRRETPLQILAWDVETPIGRREVLEEEFRFQTLVTKEQSTEAKSTDVFRIRHWIIPVKKPEGAPGQDRRVRALPRRSQHPHYRGRAEPTRKAATANLISGPPNQIHSVY